MIIVPEVIYLDGKMNIQRTQGCANAFLPLFHYCVLSKALVWNLLADSLYYAN